MAIKRRLVHIDSPQGQPGFLGSGHIAVPVIQRDFSETDPFIMLMDDRLDKKDTSPAGGPHPHAGFETVTLMIEGDLNLGTHSMKAGDMQMMTAGSGIIHTEIIDKPVKLQILQLWLSLPQKDRWVTPRVQDISLEHVPYHSENGMSIRLYSGSLNGLHSPVKNYAPLILADIQLEPGTADTLHLPANYNGFVYVLKGNITVGDNRQPLQEQQVGWLNLLSNEDESELEIAAGNEGARLVLYAGKPTGDAIKPYGPFIGNNSQDIIRLYQEYHDGKMQHISTLPESQALVY